VLTHCTFVSCRSHGTDVRIHQSIYLSSTTFEMVLEMDPTSNISTYVRTMTLCDNFTCDFPRHPPSTRPPSRCFRPPRVVDLKVSPPLGIRHSDLASKWFCRFRTTLKTLTLESCSLPQRVPVVLHIFPLSTTFPSTQLSRYNQHRERSCAEAVFGGVTRFRGV